MTSIIRAAFVAALVALAACGSEGITDTPFPIVEPTTPPTLPPEPPVPSVPAGVRISPRQTTVLVGATARLAASVNDAQGRLLPDAAVTWVSLDATTADVSANGTVTAQRVGLARIMVLGGGGADTAVVTVATTAPPPVGSVSVTPALLALESDAGQQIAALARDGQGIPLTDRPITWTSSAAAVATVTASGYVRAVADGSALVIASAEGRADTVRVTVGEPGEQTPGARVATVSIAPAIVELPVGDVQQLDASAFDTEGRPVTGRTVTWSSADAGVVSVSRTGVVSAVAVGATTVRATVDGVTAELTVRVTPPRAMPASLVTSTASLALDPGMTRAVEATVLDQDGIAVTGYNITWSTGNAAVATVTPTGEVTAVANGTTTITVTGAGFRETVHVSVGATGPGSESVTARSYGSVARSGGGTVMLPYVLVVGDDDPAALAPIQAIAVFSLAGVPAGATIDGATLGITIDTDAAFGEPYALGALHAERASSVDVNTAAPAAGAVLLASAPTATISADLEALVQAAIAAGADHVTVRFRFATASNGNAQTDQLELALGTLALSWTR